jgi:hypothetical protein
VSVDYRHILKPASLILLVLILPLDPVEFNRPRRPTLLLPPLGPADNAAMQTEPSTTEPPKLKRRRFQFSLRTLLIFVLICADSLRVAWTQNPAQSKGAGSGERDREVGRLCDLR